VTGAIVRTVGGDIDPADLGPCDAHEHLFLTTPLQPGEDFLDVERNAAEARTVAEAGARAIVDWTPIGLGRDPAGLRAVAERAGLHVVAATGLHRDAHYRPGDPLREVPPERLADRFAAEVTGGMDDGTVRAGLIKCGASYHHVTDFEGRVLEAAAETHRRTGAPIGVHTQHGTHGGALVGRLAALGVAPASIILAHVDRNPDPGEHAETAAAGAWLQLDGPGRTKYWPDSTLLAFIADLAELGFERQLLIGGDTGRSTMLRAYGGGPGMDYVFARFRPRLARELSERLADTIFVGNPARAFAFVPA
jgi:phosphotriesterase-related protein